ncbi:MAG: hypothetical protein ABII25_00275, partial [bacterium]
MRFKKWAMFSVASFLILGIVGCELPGQNKGDAGPSGGYYTPPPPPTDISYNEPMWVNIIIDRYNVGFGEAVNLKAEVGGGRGSYIHEWNCSEGYFDNRRGNPV